MGRKSKTRASEPKTRASEPKIEPPEDGGGFDLLKRLGGLQKAQKSRCVSFVAIIIY